MRKNPCSCIFIQRDWYNFMCVFFRVRDSQAQECITHVWQMRWILRCIEADRIGPPQPIQVFASIEQKKRASKCWTKIASKCFAQKNGNRRWIFSPSILHATLITALASDSHFICSTLQRFLIYDNSKKSIYSFSRIVVHPMLRWIKLHGLEN